MSKATYLPVTHPGGEYQVIVGRGLLSQVTNLVGIRETAVIITDDTVGPLYTHHCTFTDHILTVPTGEQYKTLETVRTIYDQLLAIGLDRKATLIALGGGVIGDMTGFVAATYMRGINFIQCPTTLLAMVDASVGGKTGVDMPQGKNLIGAFKQPLGVIADLETLYTLHPAEFASGMAEVIKHGLIANPTLLTTLESGDWLLDPTNQTLHHNLQQLVVTAIEVKRNVVQADPYEHGQRAMLNLGHTFGHAIEQLSQYQIRHGEGVAMGLVAAANLSARCGFCDPALQTRIEAILTRTHLPTRIPPQLDLEQIYHFMGQDKKKAQGKRRFILLRDIAKPFITADITKEQVLATLTDVQEDK